MTVADKRLEEAALALTVRERAVLILRPWIAGGEGHHRLRKHAPADQKDELARIEKAIDDYNSQAGMSAFGITEWLFQEATQFGVLECVEALLVSESHTKPKGHRLPPPSTVERWLKRDLPMVYGVKAFPDDEDVPAADWTDLRDQLRRDLRRSLELRWQDLAARRMVMAEVNELMGEEMLHVTLRDAFDAVGTKLLAMYERLLRLGERFELPEVSDEKLEDMRGWVRWDDLRGPASTQPVGPNNGRGWMRPEELAELEALEAQLAAELRAQKK